MNFDWQNLMALFVVAAAGAYLARIAWRSLVRRKASGCGSCGSCASGAESNQPQVFAIERAPEIENVASNGKLGSNVLHQ